MRDASEMKYMCNERLIFININLIKCLEWLCELKYFPAEIKTTPLYLAAGVAPRAINSDFLSRNM